MKTVWKKEYIILAYEYAKGGFKNGKIAKLFGVHIDTIKYWEKTKSMFKMALKMGRTTRKEQDNSETFPEYVYGRLSKENKRLYKEIMKFDRTSSGVEKIEALLTNQGVRARQNLFLHAWVSGNFSLSKAMRRVCISRPTFNLWSKDPIFCSMVKEIDEYKGDFFEEHLFKLVKGGSESATVFANKTFNRKRGYDASQNVNLNVSGQITHNVIPIESLKLPIKIRKQILKAMRKVVIA